MKHWFVLLTVLLLLGCGSMVTPGAVHNYNSDYNVLSFFDIGIMAVYLQEFISDTWFSVEPLQNNFQAQARIYEEETLAEISYYLNDFTFGDIFIISDTMDDSTLTNLRGSYWFDCGLLVGLNYMSGSQVDTTYQISPGYAYKIGDNGYAAFSVDYLFSENRNDLISYDLDLKYFSETAYFFMQVYAPTDNNILDDVLYNLGVNLKITEDLTVGIADCYFEGNRTYFAGSTWTNELLILDFQIGSYYNEVDYYRLSGMFSVTESIALGLEYSNDDDSDPQYTVKFKYATADSKFFLGYTPENDTDPTVLNLMYQQSLN